MTAYQPSLRRILWERQEQKCAGCGVEIASHKDSCRTKLGDEDFVACAPCVSTVGEYQSLADFNRDHSTGERQIRLGARKAEKEANRVENPEGYQMLVDAVRALGSDAEVPDHFRYLPATAKFDSIAYHLVHGALTVDERRQRAKEKEWRRRKRRGRIHGSRRIPLKQGLGEAQNHRCAYCHCGMHYEKHNDFRDWQYATFEHVLDVKSAQGINFNAKDNLVLACMFCNMERSRLALSAEQFYEWVRNHRVQHEARLCSMAHPPFISRSKWLKRGNRLQSQPTHHINKVPLMTEVK